MIIAATYPNPIEGKIAIVFAVLMVCIVLWLFLSMAERVQMLLGKTGMNVVTRMMGLLMLAVAMEFLTGGLGEKFPALVRAAPAPEVVLQWLIRSARMAVGTPSSSTLELGLAIYRKNVCLRSLFSFVVGLLANLAVR